MVRMRKFDRDVNVLDAARMRIDRVLDGCDRIAVAFSGGKDSLATLHLVRERMLARGDDRPVAAVYRDMEFVNESVTEKVEEVFDRDWIDGRWLCLRSPSETTIAGQAVEFTPWDPAREWKRPMPEQAYRDDLDYDPPAYDRLTVSFWPGRVIIATGLRAAESLIRYRAVANKLSEPWLAKSKADGVHMARPIYDWVEADVLRYLYDVGDLPAGIYAGQVWAGQGELRTASLLAVEQMRDLPTLKASDPQAYADLLDFNPDVATQERYDRDLKDRHQIGRTATSLREVRQWIDERFPLPGKARQRALGRLTFALGLARNNPNGFPPWWVQHEIARNGHGTGMMPLPKDHPRYGENS